MSFPKYPKYKDSGVKWLGDIPEHWRVVPLRWASKCCSGEGISVDHIESIDDEEHSVPVIGGNGLMGYTNQANVDHTVLAVGRVGALCGNIHIVHSPAWITDNALILDPTPEVFCLDFLSLVIRSRNLNEIASKTAQPLITGTQVSDQRIPAPTPIEQLAISSFLDRETSKIDALVGEQRRLIELLKEKRQAVISRAVTKGLNPNAPLKPSGIEWLGDVPEHWETRTIAKASSKITNGFVGPTRDILVESGTPYIQATHIKKGRVIFDEGYFVTQEWSKSHAKSILAEGDVLIVQTGAGTGDVGLVSCNEVGYNCHALIIVTCLEDLLLGAFLAAVLQSDFGHQRLESIQTGGMHPHLNCGNVKYVEVPVPPNNEQAEIVAHINEMSATFDALTAEAERAIELLQERRTALISAAVTGKIDVREFDLQGAKQ